MAARHEHHDLLFAYSEWLDSEGLIKPDHEVPSDSGGSYVVDDRPHDQLVIDFLEQQPAAEGRSLHTAVRAAAEAICACDGAGCEETYARRLLLRLLAEEAEQKAGA